MKTKNYFFLTALLAMGFAACTEMDDMPVNQQAKVPVKLTTQLSAQKNGITRAAINLNETKLTAGDVAVFTEVNYATKYTYEAQSTGALTCANPPYYPTDGSNINIVAVYPATPVTAANAVLTHDVAANQIEDADYKSSDLMRAAATANKVSGASSVNLPFQHKMAKIIVNVTAGDGVADIYNVQLLNIKRRITYTPSTDALGEATAIPGNLTVAMGTNNCAAVIPPQSLSGDFIKIVTDQGDAIYSLVGTKTVAAGNYYQLDITVNRAAVGTTNSIEAWSGSGSVTINPVGTSDWSVAVSGTYTYDGSPKTPAAGNIVVTSATNGTISSSNYGTYVENNTNAGDATLVVYGKGAYAGECATTTYHIDKAAASISYATTTVQKYVGDASFTNTLTKTGDGTVTYSSSSNSVATVNANTGAVTVVGAGTATITATVADGSNYTYATKTRSYTLNVSSQPAQGMMYFTDGTYGNVKGDKTVAGIVVYVDQPGTADDALTEKSSGFGHALVMALEDVSSTQTWGPTDTDETFLYNCQSLSDCQSNDLSGLSNTASLIGDSHTHNAASQARSFNLPAAPESKGSSKWFLPSAAQWYAVLGSNGLGGFSSLAFNSYFDSSQTSFKAINDALIKSGVGGTALTNNAGYWSSSEYNSDYAVGVYFDSSDGVYVSKYSKSNGYRVRAFLAF